MAPGRWPRRHSCKAFVTLTVLAGIAALGGLCLRTWAFVAPRSQPTAEGVVAEGANLQSRRELLAGFGALVGAAAFGENAAHADEKQADALQVTGREGTREDINGRWSIVFGKKVNGRAVYRKDGASNKGDPYFLLINDCKQFSMTTKIAGECNGFGLKTDDGWKIDGKVDPAVKMKPFDPKEDPFDIKEPSLFGEMKLPF